MVSQATLEDTEWPTLNFPLLRGLRVPEGYMKALEWAVRLHRERVWPGSGIPRLASVLEVACRVSAWGATEEEVIASLLHALPPGEDSQAFLASVQMAFGSKVAGLLDLCWRGNWLPGEQTGKWSCGEGYLPPEARLLVTCATLVHLRCVLLDWVWLNRQWTEDPTPNRQSLCRFYRHWISIPAPGTGASPTGFPALDLAYGPAWELQVVGSTLVDRTKQWGLPFLATELSELLDTLRSLPKKSLSGFLLASWHEHLSQSAEALDSVIRRCNLKELAEILEYQTLMGGPAFLLDRLPIGLRESLQDRRELLMSRIPEGEHILIGKLLELVEEGLLVLPNLQGKSQEVPFAPASGAAFSQAVLAAAERLYGQTIPYTSIPAIFPLLEKACLALTEDNGSPPSLLRMEEEIARPFPVQSHPRESSLAANLTVLRWLVADFESLEGGLESSRASARRDLQELFSILVAVDGRKGWQDVVYRLLGPVRVGGELRNWLEAHHQSWVYSDFIEGLPAYRNESERLALTLWKFSWGELADHCKNPRTLAALNEDGIGEIMCRIDRTDLLWAIQDPAWARVKEAFLAQLSLGSARLLEDELAYLKPNEETTLRAQLTILRVFYELKGTDLI